jgi:hypothetical protein
VLNIMGMDVPCWLLVELASLPTPNLASQSSQAHGMSAPPVATSPAQLALTKLTDTAKHVLAQVRVCVRAGQRFGDDVNGDGAGRGQESLSASVYRREERRARASSRCS